KKAPVIKLREKRRAGVFTVVVDDIASNYDGNDEAFERVLEKAVSVAHKLALDEVPVVLRGIAAAPVHVESAAAWEDALRWSAAIQLSSEEKDFDVHEMKSSAWGETFFFSLNRQDLQD
ncbi:MAG: hypothetical protein AB1546_16795, partial [bacterium]